MSESKNNQFTEPRNIVRRALAGGLMVAMALTSGCAASRIAHADGYAAVELDPSVKGPVSGVGIEGQDVVAMTDQMVRDMLQTPTLAGRTKPPRVIVDGEYFANDSSQALNKNSITDRLRVALNRSSQGRMTFVGRNYARMVQEERDLKRAGVTDAGTTGLTRAQSGGDFRLGGRISSLDSRSTRSGLVQRYNQIVFEMVDLESGEIVWSGMYEFARAAADDVVYR